MSAEKLKAWCVHAYTSLGLVAAALMAVQIVRGGDDAFRIAFGLMLAATLIDGSDGWLARRFRVDENLPEFDGRRLDDLIDFLTYTCLPLLLVWRAGLLPESQSWWLLAPLLASAYGFSQADAKTADGYFLGFPSYWNVVAFYLYFLRPPVWLSLTLLLSLSALTLAPLRYLYPTQPGAWNRLMRLLGVAWAGLLALVLVAPPGHREALALASLAYPLLYLVASWWVSLRRSG